MSNENSTSLVPAWMSQTSALLSQFPAEKFNHVLPTATIADVAGQFYKARLEVVTIDPTLPDRQRGTPGSGEVYRDQRMPGGTAALTRRGIQKFAHAAGIVFPPQLQKPIKWASGKFAHAEVYAAVKKADGTLLVVQGSKIVDAEFAKEQALDRYRNKMKDGRREFSDAEAASMAHAEYLRVVENMVQNAETKAQLRAIRKILALKDAYPMAELARPFVVIRFDQSFDINDPMQARILIAQAQAAAGQIYPTGGDALGGPPTSAIATAEVIEPEADSLDAPPPVDPLEARLSELLPLGYDGMRDRFKAAYLKKSTDVQAKLSQRWKEVHLQPENQRAALFARLVIEVES